MTSTRRCNLGLREKKSSYSRQCSMLINVCAVIAVLMLAIFLMITCYYANRYKEASRAQIKSSHASSLNFNAASLGFKAAELASGYLRGLG